MKVLLYSHCFYPSVGGLETVSMTLADGFIRNGVDCKVVTTTPGEGDRKFSFDIIRNPGRKQQVSLIKWADVVLFNGASLALLPWLILLRKPFVWVHVGYQVSCIDGLGWVNGQAAPLRPFSSFLYHKKLKGLKHGIKDGLTLFIRRLVARHLVSRNIAITEWMNKMQPLPRQVHIYNPFPLDQFAVSGPARPEYDFLYLGRIVSEKGILTLLKAFAQVQLQTGGTHRLLLIGDGEWRAKMEQAAQQLRISDSVTFAGKQTGAELVEWVGKGKIAIVPSEWYEPMGGAALELMASGKNLIVSEKGGLKECVGKAGLTFPNGDHEALASCMVRLLQDVPLQQGQLQEAKERVKLFSPDRLIAQYIMMLKEVARLN